MNPIITLATGESWPLGYDLSAIDFRTLGRHLAARAWMYGMMHPAYSYADHLLDLAAKAPKALRLEALLLHAHMAIAEGPVLLVTNDPTTDPHGEAQTKVLRAPFPPVVHNSLLLGIRQAAELDAVMSEAIKQHLWDLEDTLIKTEMRDLKHNRGIPRKGQLHPRTPEAAAAEWADQVEQRIPRIMVLREVG
ncbi:hypothetical protein SAMN04515647_4430 [Cohaesibacter sp. ES.047]|uniref:hypothetical protein n=1 Tax=Cohaesibacter sp. ES.047 TaxID=1798205 RepID=UPI000BB7FA69|nr:hypothetical protein [Cohaesibacter sp. ES.047]SNY94107.1 hypothetical protein SAMN04515647_4430 [Cohaesibacter sp. ES.047]